MTISLPSFELLEARILMSASVQPQPDVQVSGAYYDSYQFFTGVANNVEVDLSNCGDGAASGKGTLRFYLVPTDADGNSQDLPDNATPFYSYKVNVHVDRCDGDQFDQSFENIKLTVPTTVAEGSYSLYVKLDAPFADTDGYNCTDQDITVTVPQLDITVADSSDLELDGRNVTGSVDLYNNGNYSDVGNVKFGVYAVPVGNGAGKSILIESFTQDVTFDDYGSAEVSIPDTTLPKGVNNGRYKLMVQADPQSGDDLNRDDNSYTMPDKLTVGNVGPQADVGISNVYGSINDGRVWFTMTNFGDATGVVSMDSSGDETNVVSVDYSVYLSTNGKVDSKSVLLTTYHDDEYDFENGDSVDLNTSFQVPDNLAPGDYTLIVVAKLQGKTDSDASDNTLASSDTVTVEAPYADVGIDDVGGSIDDGQVWFTTYNYGTMTNVGQIDYSVYLSTSGQVDDQAILVTTFQGQGDFSDGDSLDVSGDFQLADGAVPQGNYQWVVVATLQDQTDVDTSDNTALSYDTVTVGVDVGVSDVHGSIGDGKVWFTLANYGSTKNVGQIDYSVYLSTSGQMDNQAVLVTTFQGDGDFSDSDSLDVNTTFQLADGAVPQGNYQWIVVATPQDQTDVDTCDNVSVSWDRVIVGRDANVSTGTVTVTEGRSGSVAVTLTNLGSQDVGAVRYDVYLTTPRWTNGPVDNSAIPVQTTERSDGTAVGSSTSFNLDFTVPDGLADGQYYVEVRATTLDGQDVDTTDNVSRSDWQTISLQTTDDGTGPVQSVSVSNILHVTVQPICIIYSGGAEYHFSYMISDIAVLSTICTAEPVYMVYSGGEGTSPSSTGSQAIAVLADVNGQTTMMPSGLDSYSLTTSPVDTVAVHTTTLDVSVLNQSTAPADQILSNLTNRPTTDSASQEATGESVFDILKNPNGNRLTQALNSDVLVTVI